MTSVSKCNRTADCACWTCVLRLHALATKRAALKDQQREAQMWDCEGWREAALEYHALLGTRKIPKLEAA